ncbi:hypothetical protein CBR_g40236 [Chara braunii]|uniref:Uncharacterized protein n=1 Tax=Chara braunii TaxID=69332 RepID=A0A388K1R1_CHABU|nr:hypothetical protein CBR_g40236 [Chara braunii]|eukprot:GBG63992.1 hypothetical protein CBR_g40236 [Chara braunii]
MRTVTKGLSRYKESSRPGLTLLERERSGLLQTGEAKCNMGLNERSGGKEVAGYSFFFHLFSTTHPHLLYAAALGSEFRQHETSTATSLRDIVVLRALEMSNTAAEWDNGDESDLEGYGEMAELSSASESEGDVDDEQETGEGAEEAVDEGFVAGENKMKKLTGKKRRKKEEGGIICCGLTKGQLLVGLTLLLLSAEAIMLVEMLF